jgi:flagellar basal body rod protein FlgC
MKKIILTIVLGTISFFGNTQVKVKGHVKSNGTYVAPYERTYPNKTINDNYSTYPNVNPHTGKVGTISPTNSKSTSSKPIFNTTSPVNTNTFNSRPIKF